MKRLLVFSVIVLSALGPCAQAQVRAVAVKAAARPAGQEARVALVIGNGAYKDAPLRNPVNDAQAMADAMKTCGFTVTRLQNATRSQMREAIRAFGARIAEGGVGLFYYAGHGMQVKGRNYMIPVGADITQEDEVEGEAVEVDAVLAKMETARNRLNIVILDACRDNPFGRSFRGTQHGLAQMDAPTGTYVAFATAPGRTAADGTGTNGLYTHALLRQLKNPGLRLEDVFKRTRAEVLAASGQKQTPWENSSIVGDFYFLPGSPEVPATPAEAVLPPPPAAAAPRPGPASTPTPSGLSYQDLREGAGPCPAKGQTCVVNYTGWLSQDGKPGRKFDSSVDRGQPFSFTVGVGQVIKGFDEGIISMKKGGKRTLHIPAALGYGSHGVGGVIPPNADLIFEVELVDFR